MPSPPTGLRPTPLHRRAWLPSAACGGTPDRAAGRRLPGRPERLPAAETPNPTAPVENRLSRVRLLTDATPHRRIPAVVRRLPPTGGRERGALSCQLGPCRATCHRWRRNAAPNPGASEPAPLAHQRGGHPSSCRHPIGRERAHRIRDAESGQIRRRDPASHLSFSTHARGARDVVLHLLSP